MEPLKVGLIGLGGQGRAHAKHFMRCGDDAPYRLEAVCDIRPEMFEKISLSFNIAQHKGEMDFKNYRCYTDMDDMLAKEKLDFVLLALPTYLHCEATVKCLHAGLHVLCEKPMAPTVEECALMLKTAKECNKHLMIGQCLRFWSEYEILKSYINSGEFGRVTAGIFHRGGSYPSWGYNDWFRHKELGGGAIFDQHVHDVDIIQYLFGMPDAVSTSGKILMEGSNFDTLCTNYIYQNGPLIFSYNDWTLSCDFTHGFRVNFEKATLEMGKHLVLTRACDGVAEKLEFTPANALAAETRYFAACIFGEHENLINPPESSMESIRLVCAEEQSANNGAMPVSL